MEALLNALTQAPTWQKLVGLAFLVFAIGGIYYNNFYADILVERQQNEEAIRKLTKEEADYKARKEQYQAFRMEVSRLQEEQKELLRILPQTDDIEQFIESVNTQVESAGLSKVSQIRDEERREDIYVRMPVRMSLVGSFHQISKFFKSIGEMQRIVTINELSMTPADSRGPTQNGPMKADFVAQTFRLLPQARPAAPAAAPGAPGAPPARPPGPPGAAPAGGAK